MLQVRPDTTVGPRGYSRSSAPARRQGAEQRKSVGHHRQNRLECALMNRPEMPSHQFRGPSQRCPVGRVEGRRTVVVVVEDRGFTVVGFTVVVVVDFTVVGVVGLVVVGVGFAVVGGVCGFTVVGGTGFAVVGVGFAVVGGTGTGAGLPDVTTLLPNSDRQVLFAAKGPLTTA